MCGRCEPSSSSSQSLSPLLCLYWACRSSTPFSTILTSRRPAVDAFRRLTRPAGTANQLAVDASLRDFLYSGKTFCIPARLSSFRRDFLPIPTRLSTDPDESRTSIGDSGDPIPRMSLRQRKEDPHGPPAGRSARRLRKGLGSRTQRVLPQFGRALRR